MIRNLAMMLVIVALSACGGQSIWAPEEEVQKRTHVSNERPYLMLKTMINNRSGSGGHASLLINGSQVVMYDPAGRWHHPWAPERNDVLFGMTPLMLKRYDSFHARNSHHVVSQKIYVSAEVAEMAMQLAFAQGPSLDAQCTINTSKILRQLPGFEGLSQTWFPAALMRSFEELPGVETTRYYEDDEGKN